ncbi:MAG: sel1 repeat family protein [Deltaproteobacteria bacterium]|jgi:hypothetical protein|nr:sel1 repeat family protein [Deltaproteobacteria bacterium]
MTADTPEVQAELLFEQGKHFYLSSGDRVNDAELAVLYFQRAASLGYAPAQRLLGMIYLEGSLVERDPLKAFELFSSAAAKGDAQASYSLALMYAQGDAVEKDWSLAHELLSRPEVTILPEANELKRSLKWRLIELYPNLAETLRQAEKPYRASLNRSQLRFIPSFLDPGRHGDEDEFEIWLSLNLGKRQAEEALVLLTDKLDHYYRTMLERQKGR